MCGILGLFRQSGSAVPFDPGLIKTMRDTMSHRGPDDAGIFISPHQEIALAHRRLSIIDLSPEASQPMANSDQSIWIVYNGEIYNHAGLRRKLESLGHKFKTSHSDTEVIIRGYEEWGESILDQLRGMFSFAIWDKKKGKLWCVRDRLGVKPLYYTTVGGIFIFASEIKALLAYPGVKRECHPHAFYDFLTFLVSPAPQTLFKNIYKLPAGHTLTIDSKGHQNIQRYWNPFQETKTIGKFSNEEWAEQVMSSLRKSIEYRMVSDVKFGVFLSGGIDSSANVALMAEKMDRPVETFSIGFEGPQQFNELEYARLIAKKYKTNHHEYILKPKDLIDFLPKLVYHQDEPIVDPVCVPVHYVSKLAKDNGTTVCQVGEGADELFCGYPYWGMMLNAQPWNQMYQKVPAPLRNLVWKTMNISTPSIQKAMRPLDLIRRASQGQTMFWGGAEAYQETTKRRFLSSTFLKELGPYSSHESIRSIENDFIQDAPEGADYLHWMSYLDLRLRLPELLLMRVDKMTMATSLESRVPFLDHKFVQLAMGIPQTVKYENKVLKALLKKAVDPILPKEIIHRKKQGFAVPINDWFQKKYSAWSKKKILDFVNRTHYFNREKMETYLDSTQEKMSWFLLNFVLWHETWIEQKELDLP